MSKGRKKGKKGKKNNGRVSTKLKLAVGGLIFAGAISALWKASEPR